MSPLAILRRQSRRAMGTLMRDHGYKRDQFEIVEFNGGHDVLPGTAMYWWKCSFEYNEWDCHSALDELLHLRANLSIDWERAHREDEFRHNRDEPRAKAWTNLAAGKGEAHGYVGQYKLCFLYSQSV